MGSVRGNETNISLRRKRGVSRDLSTRHFVKKKEIKTIKINKIKCKKCSSIIKSRDINNFKRCSCGTLAIAGGYEYLKRIGNINDYEELYKYDINNIQEGK